MRIIQFSGEYRDAIIEYGQSRGIPSGMFSAKIEWLPEPGIARSDIRFLRFTVINKQITIDLKAMSTMLDLPYSLINLRQCAKAFAVGPEYLPLIQDYCSTMKVDYDSLVSKLDILEGEAIPEYPNKTHISVRSLKPGKLYDVVYAPKLLKFLRDPSYGTWMYVSETYRDTTEITAELMGLDWKFLDRHIAWVTDEEDTFHVTDLNRVALYSNGQYKYLSLARFKNVALGKEPYDE